MEESENVEEDTGVGYDDFGDEHWQREMAAHCRGGHTT